jgi:hypothetical protein
MKFITRTGSVYQIDTTNKKIRRLEGKANPTPQQGTDGEWKSYERISCLSDLLTEGEGKIEVGEGVLIVWVQSEHAPLSEFGGTKTTLTSDVVEIIEE